MKYNSDRDGKSKTASGVDADHYPEQHEVANGDEPASPPFTHEQIAKRAEELWRARGCPEGSAEEDWLQAEQELRAGSGSGSVQR